MKLLNVQSLKASDMLISFTIEVARKIEKIRPDIHFVVIGRQADDTTQSIPSFIHFTGLLPDRNNYITHIEYSNICFLPFPKWAVAGGARNKALDYFARVKLVVATQEGLRGLEQYAHNQHVIVAGYSVKHFLLLYWKH